MMHTALDIQELDAGAVRTTVHGQDFLSEVYMPEQYERWHKLIIDFAKRIGKPDPEVYVDDGWWKARQGRRGYIGN